MAIQVSGTEVISNARALTNIASADATTVATLNAAGVGGGLPYPPNWNPASTPNVTYSSSTTWTKPVLADDTWVVFYAVGGGAGGGPPGTGTIGGGGGAAAIYANLAGELPASVVITIGAGGYVGGNGGNTTLVASGVTRTAVGGRNQVSFVAEGAALTWPFPVNTFGFAVPTQAGLDGGKAGSNYTGAAGFPSIYGGGGGGGGYYNNAGGTSTYAGNGGAGVRDSAASPGVYPGGGGGGSRNSSAREGAGGSVRIWYLT